MKKFVSRLLLIIFCLSLTAGCADISAKESNGDLPTTTGFVVWDGIIYPMTDEELARFETNPSAFDFYNESQPDNQPTPNALRSYYLSDSGYPKTYLDSTYQDYITPCYGGGSYGTEVTTQMSFSQTTSYTAGGNLTASYQKIIEATLSGTVTQSLTRYSGMEYTVSIPAHQYMKLRFTPRVKEVKGTFVEEYAQVGGAITELTTPVAAKFFIEKNSIPDGSYVPVFKNYGW